MGTAHVAVAVAVAVGAAIAKEMALMSTMVASSASVCVCAGVGVGLGGRRLFSLSSIELHDGLRHTRGITMFAAVCFELVLVNRVDA